MGVLGQLGMNTNTTNTAAAATEAYEFLSESLTTDREVIRTEGLRGTRYHHVERVRQGRQTPSGDISMQPTYTELTNLLPRCLGAAVSGAGFNTYTPSDTVPVAFQTIIDRVTKVFTYTNCRVGRAVFKSGIGQPLELTMSIEAEQESIGNAGSFAGGLTVAANAPFIWTDGVLTLGGTGYQVMEWETTVDWHLKTDRFVNSLTRTDLPSMDLTVGVRFTVPYTSDTVGLYDAGGGTWPQSPGITGNIAFSWDGGTGQGGAGVSLLFTYGQLVFPAKKSPAIPGRDEITLLLEGEARAVSTTAPLAVQLDSTP